MNVGVMFGIIISIIVIVMTLTFGSQQIAEILGISAKAQVQKSLDDIETTIARVYNLGEGSVLEYRLTIPDGIRLCFMDPDNPERNLDPDLERRWNPDNVVVSIIQEERFNVWMESPSSSQGFAIDFMKPVENFCARSGTRLFIENRGLTVGITD